MAVVWAAAHPGGVAGRVAAVFTHSFPGTAEAGAVVHAPPSPGATEAAAELVAAPLPGGVAGPGAAGFSDSLPSTEAAVFSDGSPGAPARGAADLTETAGVSAGEAAPPRAAVAVASASPNCLLRTAAAAAQVFTEPPPVLAGEAPVVSHAPRGDAAGAVVLFAVFFRVFPETKLPVFAPSLLTLAAAVTGPAVCPPPFGCVSPRVPEAAAAVDGDPLLEGAFQRPRLRPPGRRGC